MFRRDPLSHERHESQDRTDLKKQQHNSLKDYLKYSWSAGGSYSDHTGNGSDRWQRAWNLNAISFMLSLLSRTSQCVTQFVLHVQLLTCCAFCDICINHQNRFGQWLVQKTMPGIRNQESRFQEPRTRKRPRQIFSCWYSGDCNVSKPTPLAGCKFSATWRRVKSPVWPTVLTGADYSSGLKKKWNNEMHTFTFTWCHVMDTSSFGTEQCFPLPAPVGCFQLHPWTDVHVAHRATRRIKKQISADFFQKLIACSRVLGHDSRASRILGLVDPFIAHRFAFAKLKLETCNLKLITSQSSQVNLVLHHIHHIIKYPIFQKKQNYVLRVIPTATVKPCLVPTARSASRVRFDANIWIFEGFGKKKTISRPPIISNVNVLSIALWDL